MKKRLTGIGLLLSLQIGILSGCGANPLPLADRNVAHHNTKDVIYTKHGKISGKAANNTYQNASYNSNGQTGATQRPFSWTQFFGGINHISNAPTNLSGPDPNSPNSSPEQQSGTPQTSNWSPSPNPTNTNQITTPNQTQTSTQGQSDTLISQVIQSVNFQRKNAGLPPLQESKALDNMANLKAEDMLKNNYFSHTSPTYGSPFDMMNQLGISYTAAGENIAEGQTSVQQVMTDWMNSSGHRANILSSTYTQIGVGHSESGNYWVQEFIK